MERERNLIMKGKTDKCPRELADHPVFAVNQQTNNQITKTRSKLKTTREKNAEKLIKQGAKWEKEREMIDEMDQRLENEMKEKKNLIHMMQDDYMEDNRERGIDLMRIKNRDYTECEMDLKDYLDDETKRMTTRFVDIRKEHEK